MRELILFFIVNFFLLQSSDLPDGFVYLNDIDNTIVVDLKYYSQSNFTGRKVSGYHSNLVILSKEASSALIEAQKDFIKLGYSLVIFDAYRPQVAVDFFYEWSK